MERIKNGYTAIDILLFIVVLVVVIWVVSKLLGGGV